MKILKLANENIKFGYLKRYYNEVFVIRHNDGFKRNCYVTELVSHKDAKFKFEDAILFPTFKQAKSYAEQYKLKDYKIYMQFAPKINSIEYQEFRIF